MYKHIGTENNYTDMGIYIVCDDKQIMTEINKIMREYGLVALADTSGRYRYLIDARKGYHGAEQRLRDLLKYSGLRPLTSSEKRIAAEKNLTLIMDAYHFNWVLVGTNLLYSVIMKYILSETYLTRNTKELYYELGKSFGMSSDQVVRNVRYAIRKSSFGKEGTKVTSTVKYIADMVIARIVEEYGGIETLDERENKELRENSK